MAFEESVVSFFVDSAVLLGIPKSVAAIYGVCFASAAPLSFSEINQRLKFSAGSISQGLKLLREVGALKVAEARDQEHAEKLTADRLTSDAAPSSAGSISASQRVSFSASPISASQRVSVSASLARGARGALRYVPDLELRKLILHWVEKRLEKQITTGRGRLEALSSMLPVGDAAGTRLLTDRVGALRAWHGKAAGLVPVAKGFLKLT